MLGPKKDPSLRELRQFGVIWFFVFGFLALMHWASDDVYGWAFTLESGAVFVGLIGLVFTPVLRLQYKFLSTVARPIGWTISHLILAIIYFLILTPTALILRLTGRDPLDRRFDPSRDSYWVPTRQTDTAEEYFRQY